MKQYTTKKKPRQISKTFSRIKRNVLKEHLLSSSSENRISKKSTQNISPEFVVNLGQLFKIGNQGISLKAYIMRMVNVIHEGVPYDVISVKLLEPREKQVRYRYICDKRGDYIESDTILLEDKLSKKVLRKKDNLLLREIENSDKFQIYFGVPLFLDEQLVGVLSVLFKKRVQLKPMHFSVIDMCATNLSSLLHQAELASHNEQSYYKIFKTLIISLESKDRYTKGHSQRVASIALRIARQMGCDRRELKVLEEAAFLHDVGKIAILDSILKKPGHLTKAEYKEIQSHVSKGATILKALEFDEEIIEISMSHHECYNGQGYPNHLKGEAIPLLARIINVADAWDAMTTDRPYRKAMSREFAIDQLKTCTQIQFCPKVVKAFLALEDPKSA